ncbi:MAG: flagellar filament capping protein FliD [Planctomycetota bacterium]
MSAIQSSIGLITGLPIQDTVDQLIAISARPRDQLTVRNQELTAERSAVDTLSSLVLSLQFSATRFNSPSTFAGRNATSSSAAVSTSIPTGSTPAVGSYQFTPLQNASANQYVSGSFSDLTEAIGGGTLRFGFGGQVDAGVSLSEFNDGAGVQAGQLRITDKSGATAVVDLRAAQTVDDVLLAINSSTDVQVTASTSGDSFTLTDNSGGAGTLSVRDVGQGTTAEDLGLGGQSTTGTTLTGLDRYGLSRATRLATLNDGAGVRISDDLTNVDDLTFTLRDGTTTFGVDLSGATTVGAVIDAINNDADNGGNLTAAISSDGRSITLTDNTGATASNLVIANAGVGTAADDLGIAADTASGTATGTRLISGLRDTLVAQLNGGAGLTLGQISITDRAGSPTATVDLTGLTTLEEVIDQINTDAAGTNVRARINDSRSGIVLEDTVGGSASLVVADGDASNTATALGIAVNAGVASVDSGSLNRQTVGEATPLSKLNGGAGVALGDFRITDSSGAVGAVDLDSTGSEAATVGDVIDRINALSISVTASINATGDGILLTDTAAGAGTLTVAEVGGGSAAADLNLLGASTATNQAGQAVIDGSASYAVDLTNLEQSSTSVSLASLNNGSGVDLGIFQIVDSQGQSAAIVLNEPGSEAFTIGDVIDEINAAGIGVSAAVNSAGTGIELTDTAGGSGTLTVNDLGSGTAAADLNLAGRTPTTNDDGQQTINGSGLFSATDAEQGALQTLVDRINDLGAGVTASIVSDLSGVRLSITADTPGADNQLLIDGSTTGFSFQEVSRAADAVALFGGSAASGGFVVTSATNQFNGVVDGLDLTVNETSGQAVTIDVTSDTSPLVGAVQNLVDSYNSVRANLDTVTDFNAETLSTGILFGKNEALRVDTDLARVLSGGFIAGAKFGSLESVGVSLNDDGTLSLDTAKLTAAFAEDPSGVEKLFTDDATGVVKKLTDAIDSLATDESSLLSSRSDALQRTIDGNAERITAFNEQLTRERDRLLLEFFQLEETISLLQSNLSSIESIQGFASLTSGSSSTA